MKNILILLFLLAPKLFASDPNSGLLLPDQNKKCPWKLDLLMPNLNIEYTNSHSYKIRDQRNATIINPIGGKKVYLDMWTCGDAKDNKTPRECYFWDIGYLLGAIDYLRFFESAQGGSYDRFTYTVKYHQHPDDESPHIPQIDCHYQLAQVIKIPNKVFCVPASKPCNDYKRIWVNHDIKRKALSHILQYSYFRGDSCRFDRVEDSIDSFLETSQAIKVHPNHRQVHVYGIDYICEAELFRGKLIRSHCKDWHDEKKWGQRWNCLKPIR